MAAGFRIIRFTISIALTALLLGCASDTMDVEDIEKQSLSAAEIYKRGEIELSKGRYEKSAVYFGEIERLFPYSEWAKRGLIMQAYALNKDENYQGSRAAASRFADFYPAEKDTAYAYYLIGLSYYDQINAIGRDQKVTREALQAFRIVSEQYPDSEYAEPSRRKFDLAYDHLASKEMEIGRYYLKGNYHSAAINRFRRVVEEFQSTNHTAEALHRLVESYLSIGLTEEAQTAGAILGHNYNASTWYKSSYALLQEQGLSPRATGNGWLRRIHRQVIKGQWL